MDEYAKLITSVAALAGAVAWPVAIGFITFVFRKELKLALNRAGLMLDRVKKATLAGLAFELDRVADSEAEKAADKSGKITPGQFEAATRIAVQTREIGTETLLKELDKLCLEYDSLRRSLPSGVSRTRAMTRIIVKMRALAPSLTEFLDAYKGSGSAGSRLAAIAMMQMAPYVADLEWLKERFSSENPFLFYHAALALQSIADSFDKPEEKQIVRNVAVQASNIIAGYSGPPDRGTAQVLEMLISNISQ